MVKTSTTTTAAAAGRDSPPPPPPSAVARATEVKYKGVRKRKWGKYVSEIRLPNSRERIWLGSYDTAEKAARAFDAALFCLRGRCAKFNFPGDAPDIPGREELGTADIQAVAQRYANSFCGGGSSSQNASQALPPQDEASLSSELDDGDSIDWSFLDTLGSDGGGNGNGVDNAGRVSDFGLFTDPYDMYMMQNFAAKNHDDDEDDDVNDPGNVPYFLWNF